MSRTVPTDFTEYGPAKLTPKRLEMINDNYKFFLADSDKADDPLNHEYYIGNVDAYADVLTMLHQPTPDEKDHTKRNVALVFAAGAAIGFAFNSPAVGNFIGDVRKYYKCRKDGMSREAARIQVRAEARNR